MKIKSYIKNDTVIPFDNVKEQKAYEAGREDVLNEITELADHLEYKCKEDEFKQMPEERRRLWESMFTNAIKDGISNVLRWVKENYNGKDKD